MLYILRFYYRQISRWLTVNGWQTGHINTYRFEAGRIRCICVNTFIDSVLQCKLICQVIFISIGNISLVAVNSIFITLQEYLLSLRTVISSGIKTTVCFPIIYNILLIVIETDTWQYM